MNNTSLQGRVHAGDRVESLAGRVLGDVLEAAGSRIVVRLRNDERVVLALDSVFGAEHGRVTLICEEDAIERHRIG
ncbi:MAG: hypothetical protein IT303_15620 [Dehalococcoidia bacterium]|nr:hypothetical protein [Dehalococcoidia bacterium]